MAQSKLSQQEVAMTPPGRAYIEAYLHPPGTNHSLAGIPNGDVEKSFILKHITEQGLAPPNGIAADQTWSAILFSIPSNETPVVLATWTDHGLPVVAPAYDKVTIPDKVGPNDQNGYRLIGQSITVNQVADAMTDRGLVQTAQFAPPHQTYCTVVQNITQLTHEIYPGFNVKDCKQAMPGMGAYTVAQASEGAFQPLQRTSCLYRWQQPQFHSPTQPTNIFRLRLDGETPNSHLVRLLSETFPLDADFCVGVVLFSGLSSKASLNIKFVSHIEYLSTPRGNFRSMLTDGAPFDFPALKNACTLRKALPPGFPAKDNFLGSLFPLAWKAIKAGGSWLLNQLVPAIDVPTVAGKVATAAATAVVNRQKPKPQPVVKPTPAPRQLQKKKKAK